MAILSVSTPTILNFLMDSEYYKSERNDIEVITKTGFNVGLVGDLRINKYINIRIEPGLYYSKRDLMYPENPFFTSDSDRLREIKSTYIHLPLMVKFSAARINNFRPFFTSRCFNRFSIYLVTVKILTTILVMFFRTNNQNLNY